MLFKKGYIFLWQMNLPKEITNFQLSMFFLQYLDFFLLALGDLHPYSFLNKTCENIEMLKLDSRVHVSCKDISLRTVATVFFFNVAYSQWFNIF